MADLTNIFGGAWSPPAAPQFDPPEAQLAAAMEQAGITPPPHIQLDGKLHRFNGKTKGKPGHDVPSWYCAFGDGVPAGRFGDWRLGVEITWRADVGRTLTPAEEAINARRLAEARKVREAELQRQREVASNTVEDIWSKGMLAESWHPYLERKGISGHGLRVTGDGRLMAPIFTADGNLSSLQYIQNEGEKRFHPSGQTSGCFWMVGTMDEPGPLFIAEGFATAATILESTNRPCAIAYSAHNLPSVTGALRDRYGSGQEIIVVADNDKSGVGMAYATQAVAKHGGRVVMPPQEGQDANDYRAAGGDLKALLLPTSGTEAMRRLEVQFGDELPAEYEPPDELVEDVIVRGKSTVIYGDSNSGKTFFALGLAAAIAEGREAYGKRTDPGIVVYLACEAPGSIKARLKAIAKFHNVSLKRIAVVPVPLNFYTGDADAAAVIAAIREIEAIKGQAVKLVIGDTLARMSSGANENSGEDMGPVMDRFEEICRATGAAMLIIHHNGKDAARGARGWSGIRAHIDTEIEVVEKDGQRSATITKQRELASKGEIIYFKLEIVEMGETKFGKPATTCVAVLDEAATENEPSKKPSKHDETVRLWEAAWWDGGAEVEGAYPYISRSFMRTYLVEKRRYADKTVRNKLDPSRDDGMVMPMVNAGILQAHQHGWQIVCPVKSSALLMAKKQCP